MNKELDSLRSVLQELRDVAAQRNDQFGVDKLDRCFFDEVSRGTFTHLSPKEQIRQIGGGIFACYLGRGERIWSDIENGHLSEDFPDRMVLSACMYYLTLDIAQENKDRYREEIVSILKKMGSARMPDPL